jgi:hypothetical protein
VADKSQALILDALTRAAAEPGGLPLLGKTGLFAASAAAKQAAEHTKTEGLVRVVRTEAKGKTSHEICVLTEKGLELLLAQANPRLVLETLVSSLDARARQLEGVLASARATQEHLQALKAHAEKVLDKLLEPRPAVAPAAAKNGKHEADLAEPLLAYLRERHGGGALDDCPLPELYAHLQKIQPSLTLGQFHDLLRRLHASRALYLHPWTGPLYELPEPASALLAGHEVAFYASLSSC